MGIDISLLWAVIILFGIMMYVIMDGFDLGVGILFPLMPRREDRDVMMNTVAPVWDGNETWLVLGGAGLMAAFPLAYAVILSAFAMPLILMLLALIFRGVAFEFRFRASDARRRWWDAAFIGGSVLATFFQGVTLGAYIDGITVVNRAYAGGALDWLTPFSVFTGIGLIVAYALLGCTWLVLKTEGPLQQRMIELARPLTLALLVIIGLLSVWTPMSNTLIYERWFTLPNLFWFAPVPILVVLTAWGLIRSLNHDPHAEPFIFTLCMIFLGYSGLGISVWPNIIPPDISIWDAAGPPEGQGFALVGALFIIPFILMYTSWAYYVFRGKVTADAGYH